MPIFDEYAWLDALTLAGLIRSGEVTALELIEAAINRLEALNPKLNAVVTPMYDLAYAAATFSDEGGPLAGVPFLIKDLRVMYAGVRLTNGCAALENYIPKEDSLLILRHKEAGLITMGKTNTPEFGLMPTTESKFLGPCHNPWNLSYMSGGSSGGAAAAVAAGIVPMAHASDGAGSIRIPASNCGVFGLKPTRARTPNDIALLGLSTPHCISRSVRDSALLLDVTAGPTVGAPYHAPANEGSFLSEVGNDPGKLKIAFTTKAPTGVIVASDCVAAVQETSALCADLGHEMIEDSPTIDVEAFVEAFKILWMTGCAWSVQGVAKMAGQTPQPEFFEPLTWALYEQGQSFQAADYLQAVQVIQSQARQIAGFFERYDLWLTPVTSQSALPLGSFDTDDDPMHGFQRTIDYVPFTPIANATGQPAMSVPLYWNEAGMPVGSHFMARFGGRNDPISSGCSTGSRSIVGR